MGIWSIVLVAFVSAVLHSLVKEVESGKLFAAMNISLFLAMSVTVLYRRNPSIWESEGYPKIASGIVTLAGFVTIVLLVVLLVRLMQAIVHALQNKRDHP